jgi:putative SOS response-associated peptidase YedK
MASHMINARAETAATKPSFRHAFAKQRCLIPADGFYEWHTPDADDPDAKRGKTGKVLKQPYFIRLADHTSLPMAGLYELWRDPSRVGQTDEVLITCTILTTAATANFEAIHDRMPMTIAADAWDAWLDPGVQDRDEITSFMRPAGQLDLEMYPVSTAVNAVANNGPQLIEPLVE